MLIASLVKQVRDILFLTSCFCRSESFNIVIVWYTDSTIQFTAISERVASNDLPT